MTKNGENKLTNFLLQRKGKEKKKSLRNSYHYAKYGNKIKRGDYLINQIFKHCHPARLDPFFMPVGTQMINFLSKDICNVIVSCCARYVDNSS